MSNETIRLLLRNLEITIHERLGVIESILQHTPSTKAEKNFEDRLSALEKSMSDLILLVDVRTSAFDIKNISQQMGACCKELDVVKHLLYTRTDSITKKEEEEKPVEAVEVGL